MIEHMPNIVSSIGQLHFSKNNISWLGKKKKKSNETNRSTETYDKKITPTDYL